MVCHTVEQHLHLAQAFVRLEVREGQSGMAAKGQRELDTAAESFADPARLALAVLLQRPLQVVHLNSRVVGLAACGVVGDRVSAGLELSQLALVV